MTQEQSKRRADRVTVVTNVAYDLVTILENKLKGVAAMEEYKIDAQEADNQQVLQLLEQLERDERTRIDEIKSLVAEPLQ